MRDLLNTDQVPSSGWWSLLWGLPLPLTDSIFACLQEWNIFQGHLTFRSAEYCLAARASGLTKSGRQMPAYQPFFAIPRLRSCRMVPVVQRPRREVQTGWQFGYEMLGGDCIKAGKQHFLWHKVSWAIDPDSRCCLLHTTLPFPKCQRFQHCRCITSTSNVNGKGQ